MARRLLPPVLLVVIGSVLWFSLLGFERWSTVAFLLASLLVLVPRLQALPLIRNEKAELWIEADNKGRQTLAQVFGSYCQELWIGLRDQAAFPFRSVPFFSRS